MSLVIERVRLSRAHAWVRHCVRCDGCGVRGPWLLGDWDGGYVPSPAGWTERLSGSLAQRFCVACSGGTSPQGQLELGLGPALRARERDGPR